MRTSRVFASLLIFSVAMVAVLAPGLAPAATNRIGAALQHATGAIKPDRVPSGVLYDRVLPLSRVGRYDGRPGAPAVGTAEWRQMVHEIRAASFQAPPWPGDFALRDRAAAAARRGVYPVAFLDARYDRIRADAFRDGAAVVENGQVRLVRDDALASHRVFAAAALRDRTYRGNDVVFNFPRDLFLTNVPGHGPGGGPVALTVDFGDGGGERVVRAGDAVHVHYPSEGTKTIQVTAAWPGETTVHAAFTFRVEALATPTPDDTIAVTATIDYQGNHGTGQGYVYLASGHSALTQPIIVVEGFDLDNTMNWDQLYALLNRENLIEDVRAAGWDIVVLNFTDATEPVEENAFVVEALLADVQAAIAPQTRVVLTGASMGALCSRYALAYMETHTIPHRVSTFISFDGPQRGANIPLGIQYWLDFFSSQSTDAAYMLSRLDTPAAREMLVYHHTSPPGATGQPDSLRAGLLADLAAVGEYPSQPRLVAIANGSGTGQNQGFNAGDQIILYDYQSFLVNVLGNVWAVPDGTSQMIFQGEINPIFVTPTTLDVTVSGTDPYDNAPGGSRDTMAQMDSTQAPYGDIIALYPSHCFVPTVSALDIDTSNLFYDVAGDPDILSHTPFDAVYFPTSNQPHVEVTAENKVWIMNEVLSSPTAAPPTRAPAASVIARVVPNPFNPTTTITVDVGRAGPVRVDVFDVAGRHVRTLAAGVLAAGERRLVWDGANDAGRRVASGVYVVRLTAGRATDSRKIVLIK